MAPVKATSLGVTPQIIDDDGLKQLRSSLNTIHLERDSDGKEELIKQLVSLLKDFPHWKFEEQVDLHEWIKPLNAIDAALFYYTKTYPNLLLVDPVERKSKRTDDKLSEDAIRCAASLEAVQSVPESVVESICIILSFLAGLLRNSTNKVLFNSVEELVDFLACADDTIVSLSLKCLSSVAMPPSLHKQQAPEGHQHSSTLHSSLAATHKRLVAMARGWGSRGSGLGLFACVTADDSQYGQGSLPLEAGEINFEFFPSREQESSPDGMDVDNKEESKSIATKSPDTPGTSQLVSVHLSAQDIVTGPLHQSPEDWGEIKNKRQRTEKKLGGMKTKTTAELFFECLKAAGGRGRVPPDRLFPLLADVRIAKDFHSHWSRVRSVQNRLMALATILHSHPSQEIMSGYFQAQPELCVELIDLLRPTVSSSTVSSAGSQRADGLGRGVMHSLSALSNPPDVPYSIRNLAIEALTALVARRDGSSGLTGVARQSNVLNELGVGKGMYLGLLPTLLRYSLASLANFLTSDHTETPTPKPEPSSSNSEEIALDMGLAFLAATNPAPSPHGEQVSKALDFVDAVLTLCSAVIAAPAGTAALTECGLIPALLSIVAIDGAKQKSESFSFERLSMPENEKVRANSQLRYIASQAIQIIEGAIATHNNASSAFHDLKGVDVLVARLSNEMDYATCEDSQVNDPMEIDDEPSSRRRMVSSRRVLLFSIVNCLTVVFHQESTANSTSTPSGGSQLRKPELTQALIEILNHVNLYGGILAAFSCSLLSDVMNADPHVVYHVHSSGIAEAFFKMMSCTDDGDTCLPPVAELIMALPNVISALALTADGAKSVVKANPFPCLLRILYTPKYAMPNSKCLLNEMSAIVGTGLDEIMRHVPSLRPKVMKSIVEAMTNVVSIGKDLVVRENMTEPSESLGDGAQKMENDRTALVQYTLNIAEMLVHILQTEDHCDPFVQANGLSVMFELFPLLIPPGKQFLANASCLSCPSVSTLAHTTIEDSLTSAFQCIASSYDSHKLLKVMSIALEACVQTVEHRRREVDDLCSLGGENSDKTVDATGVLEEMPSEPFFAIRENAQSLSKALTVANYLRGILTLQWHTSLLSIVIRSAAKRCQDSAGWMRSEREWKKELSSPSFESLLLKLSDLHQSAIFEACRIRTTNGFESSYIQRHQKDDGKCCVQYRLRIICQEGAVVRDGIEIDSCNNVGSMEMGEIVDAYDRCINSSGVMRYRTRRGWVSELTRGHGREPIAEVIDMKLVQACLIPPPTYASNEERRVEFGIASLRDVGASVLARTQSYKDLMSALSRVLSHGVQSLPTRTMSFQQGTIGAHCQTLLKTISSCLLNGLNRQEIVQVVGAHLCDTSVERKAGASLYLSSLIGIIQYTLFEERRERRMIHSALLLQLSESDSFFRQEAQRLFVDDDGDAHQGPAVGLYNAVSFVIEHSVEDASQLPNKWSESEQENVPDQVLSRSVAASLPTVIEFLRKLQNISTIRSSSVARTLTEISASELNVLMNGTKDNNISRALFSRSEDDDTKAKFEVSKFVRAVHLTVATTVGRFWTDTRLKFLPAHVLHPLATLSLEIISNLEQRQRRTQTENHSSSEGRARSLFSGLIASVARRQQGDAEETRPDRSQQEFEPDEDAISRLVEMGFTHDHAVDALENTRSNRVEVAAEYALAHPPPSPGTIERRRQERQARQRQREESQQQSTNEQNGNPEGDQPNPQQQGTDGQSENSAQENVEGGNEKNQSKETMEKEARKAKIAAEERRAEEIIQSCLGDYVDSSWKSAFSLLCGAAKLREQRSRMNADVEALTVVLSSFVIAIFQKYKDRRQKILHELVSSIQSLLGDESTASQFTVKREAEFAALCHAAVLFTRAIPKCRILVLERGLVSQLVGCLHQFMSSMASATGTGPQWPRWLAPCILFLDVMAQPMAAFPHTKDDTTDALETEGDELAKVKMEHKREAMYLSQKAQELFSSISAAIDNEQIEKGCAKMKVDESSTTQEKGKEVDPDKEEKGSCEKTDVKRGEPKSLFETIPPYFPLLPRSLVPKVLDICCDILRSKKNLPAPNVVHSSLVLLAQLLKSPSVAASQSRTDLVDVLLSLPGKCRFDGNSGLVTMILRRVLEDEEQLQVSMETEIRSILTKLHRKRNRHASSSSEKTSASKRAFMQAVTPLLSRDPLTFLRSIVSTVSFEKSSDEQSVKFLTTEERTRNMRVINDVFRERKTDTVSMNPKTSPKKSRNSSLTKSHRGKSSHRGSLTRKNSFSKRNKRERAESDKSSNRTPNHVMSLLIAKLLKLSSPHKGEIEDKDCTMNDPIFEEEKNSFLWVSDVLEVMGDLVLSVPACAAAIHRYKVPSHKGNKGLHSQIATMHHSLSGCPKPPATVVSFLLHILLPQDRASHINREHDAGRRGSPSLDKELTKSQNISFQKVKIAQATARLLVALVARPGEGRRRVVSDLAFALSGGCFDKRTNREVGNNRELPHSKELCALQAWGDLCIGLAAPRSNGQNYDNNTTLSFEVVKLMMDFRMMHALLYALGRVKLEHPNAALVCASLLVPIEVFSRFPVVDSVQGLVECEAERKAKLLESNSKKRGPERMSSETSQRSETVFADDAMLEDGFDAEAATRNRDDPMAHDNEMEAEDEQSDRDDNEEDDAEEDENESSDEDDIGSETEEDLDSDGNSQNEETSDDEDDDDEADSNSDEDAMVVEENDNGWDEEENEEFFEGDENNEESMEGASHDNDRELWDRATGLSEVGGMLGGLRRAGRANLSSRTRGFMDAAEDLIGNLLRTGEIQSDALREIEGTLGIQIMTNRNPRENDQGAGSFFFGQPASRGGFLERNSTRSRDGVSVGGLPPVNQCTRPDTGFGSSTSTSRWSDVSSMEYVYGGPSLSGCNGYFNVTSRSTRASLPNNHYHVISNLDRHLFPRGPAASTHLRNQPATNPLLARVDLPPMNALVSDLESQNERLLRRAQGPSPRRGVWGSISVFDNALAANTLRVNSNGGNRTQQNETSRTNEDFLDLGGVSEFRDAFENALVQMAQSLETQGTRQNENLSTGREDEQAAETVETTTEQPQPAVPAQNDDGMEGVTRTEDDAAPGSSSAIQHPNPSAEEPEGAAAASGSRDHSASETTTPPDQEVNPPTGSQPQRNDVGTATDPSAQPTSDPPVLEATQADANDGNQMQDSENANAQARTEENTSDENEHASEEEEGNANGSEGDGDAMLVETSHNQGESNDPPTENEAQGLVCPPGMDLEVFHSLPEEMQREVVEQHQTTLAVAAQLDSTSGLDPEALAALPPDVREEVIAQDRRERQMQDQAPADPANAEEMDNASFVASLAPDLRREILLTADDAFLNSLPPNIIAEAQILRERASIHHRRAHDHMLMQDQNQGTDGHRRRQEVANTNNGSAGKRKQRHGKLKVECERTNLVYLPEAIGNGHNYEPFGSQELRVLFRLLFLLSPVRPPRLLQKVFQNLCGIASLRGVILCSFSRFLNDDGAGVQAAVSTLQESGGRNFAVGGDSADFPPRSLIGAAPDLLESGGMNPSAAMFRRRTGASCAASIAANLPSSSKSSCAERHVPPVVSTRVIDTLSYLGKNSPRVCLDILGGQSLGDVEENTSSCFEQILDLLFQPRYKKSSTNLEQLLTMIEILIAPLGLLSRNAEEDCELSEKDIEAASASGKEWVDVPKVVVTPSRLQLLCSILKMESCRDTAFTKVNTIVRRLCRVEMNRCHVLAELATVAVALGDDAKRDLKALNIRMNDAIAINKKNDSSTLAESKEGDAMNHASGRSASSSITLSSSSSEIKLLRVLQTLHSLCFDSTDEDMKKRTDHSLVVTSELVAILQRINLNELWDQLGLCLKSVKILEGISSFDESDEKENNDEENNGENDDNVDEESEGLRSKKKLQNSSAGLLTRFLPAIEAFFVVNASMIKPPKPSEVQGESKEEEDDDERMGPIDRMIGGTKVIDFVSENKVLLNALIRNNAGLMEKGLRAMVQVPRCRVFLDFDVKRQWFKTQIRRLRQQASRQHGSLRLNIRRKHVFEDAYHQLRLRNADEMRSRIHITFRNEEGVDAGGLSREFFGTLAKEMFNPNYALFTSTEDGCTFQPNQHSSINPDHLSYFRFVGRIVGKAVADGFLLDAHFTRSLYKHMLGLEPTHHDMEAIDPDYYKNLKMILEHNLVDIGVELTFSIEDHSFGRSQVIDLIPNGRNIPVTDESKAKYVSLICKHRMTTSIKSQIRAYLDGFYELVSRDLIAIFSPRELELLISGLPDIDLHDLKQNTEYQGWKATDKEIEWFWNIMFSFSRSEKASFLQFVTGSSKVPLAGFSELQGMRGIQKFSIHKVSGSSSALMSAHTCFNSLDMPKYESEEKMREKMLYAITEGQGGFLFA